MPLPHQHRTLGFIACALASSLWGCGFFFGKIALAEMSVGPMVLYRFLSGTLVLLPLLVIRRPHFDRSAWGLLLLASLLGVPLQFLIQFSGLAHTTVSHASLMVGTMPVLLAIGAAITAHERMDRTGWIALAASTCGATLIALSGGHSHSGEASLVGDLLVIASMFIALFWLLINKHLMERHDHIVVTAYGTALGTLMLLIWVPYRYGVPPLAQISIKAWLALAASGILCTAATTLLWNWGMTQVPASQAGILLNMEPLIGSILGVFVLGEKLGPPAWFGGGLILAAAITLTTHSKTHTPDTIPIA